MPELPEIETVRRVTEPFMTGKTIVSVDVETRKMVMLPSVEEFVSRLTERRIVSVGRRAKVLLVDLDDGSRLVIRFGMTGAFLPVPVDDPVHKHTRISFDLDDGIRMEFRDMRKFGHLWLIPPDTEDTFTGLADVGIEPDDPALDGMFLLDNMGGSSRAVKTALLDQGTVCGLGNIYTDEVLWRACICPERPCSSLRKMEWDKVAMMIPEVISDAIEGNAVTAEEFLEDGGVRYRYRRMDAYGRSGLPCGRCGTVMVRSVIGQRSSVWCPACQPHDV